MLVNKLLVVATLVALANRANGQCHVQKLKASSDQAVAFGCSVDVSGDLAVIGAAGESTFGIDAGAAYVFERTATGWTEVVRLFGDDPGPDEYALFGGSVAIHDGTIVVGAPGDGPPANSGAAYVFEFDGLTWTQTAKLVASDAASGLSFGVSVAVDGDRALIGAYGANGASGAACVFERAGTTWAEVRKLTASDGQPSDFFGRSVALSGDLALIGADGHHGSAGAAYIFDGSMAWAEVDELVPSDTTTNQSFGWSVAVHEHVAVIGARGDTTVAKSAGAAYVFERDTSGWQFAAKLLPGDGEPLGDFGHSVALGEDFVVVGDRSNGPGAAYQFVRGPSGWRHGAIVSGNDSSTTDDFGTSVALDGEAVLVGASYGGGPHGDRGAAYVFQFPSFAEAYCFGTGCPCGNDDPLSGGCANSVPGLDGDPRGTLLATCGSGSIATDDLVLTLSHLPPNKFGLFYMGGGQTQVPFGDGLQCVSAGGLGIFRYNPPQSSGGGGVLTLGPGIAARSQTFAMNGRIDAGETWYFQGWYRDPMGPCGTGFNLSNALAVTFAP